MLTLSTSAGLVFLIVTAPLAFLGAFNDLKNMKLPNGLVTLLGLVYVVSGPFVLAFDQYLWGFAHFAIMYVVAMFLYAFAGVGAGDGKYVAVLAMYIPAADALSVLAIFSAFLLGAFGAHRFLRLFPAVRRMTPDWVSWEAKKFPMGLAITGTQICYFALAAFFVGQAA